LRIHHEFLGRARKNNRTSTNRRTTWYVPAVGVVGRVLDGLEGNEPSVKLRDLRRAGEHREPLNYYKRRKLPVVVVGTGVVRQANKRFLVDDDDDDERFLGRVADALRSKARNHDGNKSRTATSSADLCF
jgi:hypothetical protein